MTHLPFYEIASILCNFADIDTTKRLNHSILFWCDDKNSGFHPYEVCLGKTQNCLLGITSSLSNMNLSIIHSQKRINSKYLNEMGYSDYDVYRYYYYVFCHSLSTIHDLILKLVVILFDIRMKGKMIRWDDMEKQLKEKQEEQLVQLLDLFYSKIKLHDDKRNRASHEGLLTYNALLPFYLTHLTTPIYKDHSINDYDINKYIEGTKENKRFLSDTKRKYVSQLIKTIEETMDSIESLMDVLLPKFIVKIDPSFIITHKDDLKRVKNENVIKFVLSSIEETNQL